jgi:hypothetical protein
MRKLVSICIAIPVDDGARCEFWLSLINFITSVPALFPKHVSFELRSTLGDSLITRARNNLAHLFLNETSADYLLFLDTDLDFQPEDIKRLVENRCEDAIVCGQYAIKQPELRYCHNKLADEKVRRDGLLKVAEAGTGCMLIPRKVLLAFKKALPRLEYTDDLLKDKRFNFFDVGVVQGRYLSEDWLFCRRVRQLGFSVLVDTRVTMGHHGWMRYPLPEKFLVDAVASRSTDPRKLKALVRGIDIGARSRWTARSKRGSAKQSKNSKASSAKPPPSAK